ncbi:MAG: DUF1311 domain-containing protein [Bacteroidia bacterium]|nr:DUF1311 domain-containing protein [Bacteroidia bacterium]
MFISLLFLIPFTGFAQSEKHSIELRLDSCHAVESNQTTAGMMNCESVARDEWFEEIDKYYNKLVSILDEDRKRQLSLSQSKWKEYQEQELIFVVNHYYSRGGTMWRIVAISMQREIVKTRAQHLKSIYDNLLLEDYKIK